MKINILILLALILLAVPGVMAVSVVDYTANFTNSANDVTAKLGIKAVPNYPIRITNVTKNSTSTATMAYILNSSGSVLDSAPFINNNASFNYLALQGKSIYIVADAGGAIYTRTYIPGWSGYPLNRTNLNFTSGYNGGDSAGDIVNILSVTSQIISVFTVTNLITPPDTSSLINPINISANHSSQGSSLANATYMVWNSTGSLINETLIDITGTYNITSLVLPTLGYDTYKWNVQTCSYNSTENPNYFCSFASFNYSFTVSPFSVNNLTYDSEVYETSNQEFNISISTISNILSVDAFLNYNSVPYRASTNCISNICNSSVRIDIPINIQNITENRTFYWSFRVFDGSSTLSLNDTEYNQSVDKIYLQECNSTINTIAMNFTAYDEGNLTRINPYKFEGTFQYWLGNGNTYKNQSFSNSSINEKTICISPGNKTFYHTTEIKYNSIDNANVTYVARNYYFQNASINNVTQPVFLYLLNALDSTSFIQSVQDENLLGVRGALISTQRYYPGDNQFRTVQVSRTDNNGKTIGFYKTETVDYKHIIVLNGTPILETEQKKIFPETSPYTLSFYLGSNVDSPWQHYENLTNLFYRLYYNDTIKSMIFTYIDTSGSFSIARLVVEQENYINSSTEFCNIESLQSSATLVCNVSTITGLINGKAYIGRSPERLIDVYPYIIKTAKDVLGRLGLLLAGLIIVAGYLVSLITLTGGLIIGWVVMFLVNLTPLVQLPAVFVWGVLAVTIIIIVAINKS